MKKLLTFCILSCAPLSTALEASVPSPNFNAAIAAGYREDQFSWRSRNPSVPEDFTESVEWKHVQIAEYSGFMNYTSCTNWYFRVNGNYGRIYSGHVLNKSYLQIGNNSQLAEENKANGRRGETFDLVGGAGYMFISSGGTLMLAPVIGYIHSEQHLHIYDINNVFLTAFVPPDGLAPAVPLGHIGGHNTYKTRWYGGFAAWDLLLDWSCNLKFFGTIQGQMGKYRGKAEWTTNEDINGFIHHKGNYVGFNAVLGFLYQVFCNSSIGISGSYRNLWTHNGKQKSNRVHYLTDINGFFAGEENVDYEQKFHARWRSWSVQGNWLVHY